jgi:hypothetical protein
MVAKPKFELGKTVATPDALRAILKAGESPAVFLDRHVAGDWGDVSEHDREANEMALIEGDRICSAYETRLGTKLWVITEAVGDDGRRASTCLMLPHEY